MEAEGNASETVSATRRLPIDGALVSEILLRLRRDAGGASIRWTLGERGVVEVDVNFDTEPSAPLTWTVPARLWDTRGLALLNCTLQVAGMADAVVVSLESVGPVPVWWHTRIPQLAALVEAAIDELAQELLWHATRV
jgi:hypothetical protein